MNLDKLLQDTERDWLRFVSLCNQINQIGCRRPVYLIRNCLDPTYWRRGIA